MIHKKGMKAFLLIFFRAGVFREGLLFLLPYIRRRNAPYGGRCFLGCTVRGICIFLHRLFSFS